MRGVAGDSRAGIHHASPEFGRVAGFSDAIFAIATTLLVLEIGVDGLSADDSSSRDMLEALQGALTTAALLSWIVLAPAAT